MRRYGLMVSLLLLAVSVGLGQIHQPAGHILAQDDTDEYETLVIPISLYVVVVEGDVESEYSSQRTPEELIEILDNANEIWAQANIQLELVNAETIEVPLAVILGLSLYRDLDPFLEQVGTEFRVPQPGLINGFYMRDIGGANGLTPFNSRLFFVMDEPSVFDERVTSHEVGHILGLHHTLSDQNRLIYPGTNGLILSEEEITVARYVAKGVLAGLR